MTPCREGYVEVWSDATAGAVEGAAENAGAKFIVEDGTIYLDI